MYKTLAQCLAQSNQAIQHHGLIRDINLLRDDKNRCCIFIAPISLVQVVVYLFYKKYVFIDYGEPIAVSGTQCKQIRHHAQWRNRRIWELASKPLNQEDVISMEFPASKFLSLRRMSFHVSTGRDYPLIFQRQTVSIHWNSPTTKYRQYVCVCVHRQVQYLPCMLI